MPARATLLARDRTVLAKGDDRSSPSLLAPQVVGQLGPIPPERREELAALGVPADAEVGVSGLERIFDERLLGTPGGELVAGARVLKRTRPHQAPAVRTTISLPVEQAAVTALGARAGRRRGAPAAHRARCSPSPGSPSRACSRPDRRSR